MCLYVPVCVCGSGRSRSDLTRRASMLAWIAARGRDPALVAKAREWKPAGSHGFHARVCLKVCLLDLNQPGF
jgi:hypothetical protein